MKDTTTFTCQTCGCAYEVSQSVLAASEKRPDDFTFKRMKEYCRPCRQARMKAMLTGPALKQVLEALASAPI